MAKFKSVKALLEALDDNPIIPPDDISETVKNSKVWQIFMGYRGCAGNSVFTASNREFCLDSVPFWLNEEKEYSARYVRGQLRRYGICYLRDGHVMTLQSVTVNEFLSGDLQKVN